MRSEITRDHWRKMGEAGSVWDQLCSCVVFPEISSQVRRAWRLGALGVGEQRVGELGEVQEHETEGWNQGLKLTNWVRPNNEDEDEGEENNRGTGRMTETLREGWRHSEMMEARLETMEAHGDDGGTRRQWR